MTLNGIIWVTMKHSRNRTTFTLDEVLTVINLIYKNLFNHQPYHALSIIVKTIKLLAKKGI